MSLHKVLSAPTSKRVISTRFNPSRLVRWQKTKASGGGFGGGKLLFYALAGAGAAAVGTITYASRDPDFKNTVNGYLPGFSDVTDSFAGQWKNIVGSKLGSEKIELVYKTERKDPPPKINTPTKKPLSSTVTKEGKVDAPAAKVATKPDIAPKQPELHEGESTAEITPTLIAEPEENAPANIQPVETSLPESTLTEPVQALVTESAEVRTNKGTDTDPMVLQEEKMPVQPRYPVESVVESVREETEKVAEKILSEQVKDHQSSQSIGEQWMQDTAKIDAQLQETFKDLLALSSGVTAAQEALVEAIRAHEQNMSGVIQNTSEGTLTMETLANDIASSESVVEDKRKELAVATLQLQEKTVDIDSILVAAVEVGLKSKAEEIEGDISKLMTDLDVGENKIREAESSSEVLGHYHEEAKRSREQLQKELGTVPPQADLKQEAIILMQTKRIDVLKQKLDQMEQEKSFALAEALDKQKQKLDELAEERIKLKLQKQLLQMEQDYVRKELEVAHEFEAEMREKLRVQSEANASHLKAALSSQASELGSFWSQELEMKLMEQEAQYQLEMSKAMARLRGIESMINTVANAGELSRQQQGIRNACDTLSLAINQTNASAHDRFTISREVTSLRKAARGDTFVLSVINSIPKQAINESSSGIQSESSLRERFEKVYRICKRVALVPETGGGLGTFALSYLQSLLVFNIRGVKEKADFNQMDSFELLSLAHNSIEKGDLERAVYYVSHLRNESQRVAQDWLADARLYLETRQAVKLIETYTSATNVAFH